MSPNRLLQTLVVPMLIAAGARYAQAQSIVGAWTRVSLRDSAGNVLQPPLPPAFAIYSANGFFNQIGIPASRPRISKNWDAMTKEEQHARLDYIEAWRGTYTVVKNKLTRKTVADIDPNSEGDVLVQIMRFAGDTLILTRVNPADKSEARFVRAR